MKENIIEKEVIIENDEDILKQIEAEKSVKLLK